MKTEILADFQICVSVPLIACFSFILLCLVNFWKSLREYMLILQYVDNYLDCNM